MIRGALIFAAGLTLGYAKAVSQQESTAALLTEARELIQAAKDARESDPDTTPEPPGGDDAQ